MTVNEYIAYFKHQAEAHPSLAHNDATNVIFEVVTVEEAMGDLRSRGAAKSFMMRLVLPIYTLSDDDGSNARQVVTGGFIIAKHHSARTLGSDSLIDALNDSDVVGRQIIAKMISDARGAHPLFGFSIASAADLDLTAQPVLRVGDGSYSGYLYTFKFSSFMSVCDVDTVGWADGGKTPF